MTVRQELPHQVPIRYVKGVGPSRAEQLARLGITSVEDALWYAPSRYEDRSRFVSLRELLPGQMATVRVRILAKSVRRGRAGQPVVQAALGDATGVAQGVWFHQLYLAKLLNVGEEMILYGRVESGPRLQLIHPEIERVDEEDDGEARLHTGRIVPIYPSTEGIGQRWLRRLMRNALDRWRDATPDVLPAGTRARHHLLVIRQALEQLHFPDTLEAARQAHRRLAFEEFWIMQVRLALRRRRFTARHKPRTYQLDGPLTHGVADGLAFTLTPSQQAALRDILRDLGRPEPMLRLLQGDVGCGKTVVAAWSMSAVVQSGYQVALMAPTELLAEQHARVLQGYFAPLRTSVRLLSQATGAQERRRILAEAADGAAAIIVGTHALLEPDVRFAKLGLVVIDEQHKFGVTQRATLLAKTNAPDVLVMSATPIPRTLALALYGDLASSTITELPPGRQPVTTEWRPEAQRADIYALLRREIQAGRQAYIVYPLVDAKARSDRKAATQMAKHLATEVFPEARVELLHGQMKPRVKERIMRAFAEGQIHILVSTVIVEVGLDVPNATVMVIEHPDRFGLAQLHQLRGRIGRGPHAATCIVITDQADEHVRARLSAFIQTSDGFRLAEQDLQLRGPGELLGRQQHGWLRFRVADLLQDRELLALARQDALGIVERDPALASAGYAPLRQRLARPVVSPPVRGMPSVGTPAVADTASVAGPATGDAFSLAMTGPARSAAGSLPPRLP